MIGRPVASPIEAYASGVRGWACAIPDTTVHVISDSSGPNERKMETLPALAVQQLSIAEAYRIGRVVRLLASCSTRKISASKSSCLIRAIRRPHVVDKIGMLPGNDKIVATIIDLAHNLKLKAMAEGLRPPSSSVCSKRWAAISARGISSLGPSTGLPPRRCWIVRHLVLRRRSK